MKEHELKTWPEYYEKVLDRTKLFEVRKNDRDYMEGDMLNLREWLPVDKKYTGRSMLCAVLGVLRDPRFVKEGFVIMSIKTIISFERGVE